MEFTLRNIDFNNYVIVLLTSCFILIVVAKILFSARFQDFFELLKNGKYLVIYGKSKTNFDVFNLLFFTVQLIGLAVFISLHLQTQEPFSRSIVYCVTFIFGFVFTKYFIEKICANILGVDRLYKHFTFQKTTYRNLIGVLLFLFNILFYWIIKPSQSSLNIALGIIILTYILSSVLAYKNHLKVIMSNLFYFILYLCALEIAPYLLIYKIFL